METIHEAKRDKLGRFLPGGTKGRNNYSWKGGVVIQCGYVKIYQPEHPRADANRYVKRSILVWEEANGRHLEDGEVVHHRNEDKMDDSPKNLRVMTKVEHDNLEGFKKRKS